jgi:hypothetical protein
MIFLRRLGSGGNLRRGNVANGIVGIIHALFGVKVAASYTRAVIVSTTRNTSSSGACSSPVYKLRLKWATLYRSQLRESYFVVVLKILVNRLVSQFNLHICIDYANLRRRSSGSGSGSGGRLGSGSGSGCGGRLGSGSGVGCGRRLGGGYLSIAIKLSTLKWPS